MNTTALEMNLSKRLDRMPVTRFHVLFLLLCGCLLREAGVRFRKHGLRILKCLATEFNKPLIAYCKLEADSNDKIKRRNK